MLRINESLGSSTLDAVEIRRMVILIETNQFEITVDIVVRKNLILTVQRERFAGEH